MHETGLGPDFISLDGAEGGSGATYQDLADGVGLPLRSALILLDDALRKFEVRDRVKIIASGKVTTPDRAAIVLSDGRGSCSNCARIYDFGRMYYGGTLPYEYIAPQVLRRRIQNYKKGLLLKRKSSA